MRFLLGASWCVFPNDQDVGLDFSVRIEGSLCKGSDTSEQVSRDRLFRLAPLLGSQDDSLAPKWGGTTRALQMNSFPCWVHSMKSGFRKSIFRRRAVKSVCGGVLSGGFEVKFQGVTKLVYREDRLQLTVSAEAQTLLFILLG